MLPKPCSFPHPSGVAAVAQRQGLGEGLQVLGARQLRQQVVCTRHRQALAHHSRAQVEVQAPVEPLANVLLVRGHVPEGGEAAWKGPLPVLRRKLLVG